jgi:hypothetical protein
VISAAAERQKWAATSISSMRRPAWRRTPCPPFARYRSGTGRSGQACRILVRRRLHFMLIFEDCLRLGSGSIRRTVSSSIRVRGERSLPPSIPGCAAGLLAEAVRRLPADRIPTAVRRRSREDAPRRCSSRSPPGRFASDCDRPPWPRTRPRPPGRRDPPPARRRRPSRC